MRLWLLMAVLTACAILPAWTAEPAEYHSKANMKTSRRPYRSGRKPRKKVPMNRPAKLAAINPAMLLNSKNVSVVVDSSPFFVRPGVIYPVKMRS